MPPKMPPKIRTRRNNNWSVFPATSTVAFYAPEAQYIELSDISNGQLARAFDVDPMASLGVRPVLLHEIRHWLDHVSTLWGRQRLVSLFDALDSRARNDEHQFWRIVDYKRALREDERDQYFSTIGKPSAKPTVNWRWKPQITMGFGFDTDGRLDNGSPIIFARFTWPDGKMACRVPVSIAALLETNAVHFEIETELSLIKGLNESSRIVEQEQTSKKWFRQLYDPELGVYSAAVHLAADHLQLSDATLAYHYASMLASIALNTPSDYFDTLIIPESFTPWGDHNRAALAQHNRGYLYLLLLHHSDPPETGNIDTWLGQTLTRAGLPALSALESAARAELIALGASVAFMDPLMTRFRLLETIGNENASHIGIRPSLDVVLGSLQALHVCPIVTGDLAWTFLGKSNSLQDSDVAEDWNQFASFLLLKLSEFTQACR